MIKCDYTFYHSALEVIVFRSRFCSLFAISAIFTLSCGLTVPVTDQIVESESRQLSSDLTSIGFPDFKYLKTVEPYVLNYNPTDESIYPTVVQAGNHLSNPIGAYYLYYAPHEAPGGINVAYSDSVVED